MEISDKLISVLDVISGDRYKEQVSATDAHKTRRKDRQQESEMSSKNSKKPGKNAEVATETAAASTSTEVTPVTEKHVKGGWQKPPSVDEIVAKAKRKEKLTPDEVKALNAAGVRKDGTPKISRKPSDPAAMNADKLRGGLEFVGPSVIDSAFANADTEDKKAALTRAIATVVREKRAAGKAGDTASALLADKIIEVSRKHLGENYGRHGGSGPRTNGVYKVTTNNRAVVSLIDLGAKVGDHFERKLIEHEGVKGVFISLTTKTEGAVDDDVADESDDGLGDDEGADDEGDTETSVFGNADPATV